MPPETATTNQQCWLVCWKIGCFTTHWFPRWHNLFIPTLFPSEQKLQKKKKYKTVFFPTNPKEIRLGFFILPPSRVSSKKKQQKLVPQHQATLPKASEVHLQLYQPCTKMNGNRWMVGLLRRKNSFELKNCDEMVWKIVTTTETFGVQNGFRKKNGV